MKKSYSKIILITIISIIVLGIYSYFHVAGNDIIGASDISKTCSVIITENYDNDSNKHDYILKEQQIEGLKTLILESNFTRVLSSVVYFDTDTIKYSIEIDFNNEQDFLRIGVIGNEYISITNQFDGKHLKINNSDFEETLKKIIDSSN